MQRFGADSGGPMADIAALAAVAFDDQRRLRERVEALKEMGRSGDTEAVAHLKQALIHEHKTIASGAAVALGNLGAGEAVPDLIGVLGTHPDKSVRMLSAEALGKIGDPAAAAPLQAAMSDRVEAVRINARSALKKLERSAAAKVRANPTAADEQTRELATGRATRGAFNLPFVLVGLAAAGAVAYWSGGSESLNTVLPVVIGAAVLVIAFNVFQNWRNRQG